MTTICVAEIDVVVMYAGSGQVAAGVGIACGADEYRIPPSLHRTMDPPLGSEVGKKLLPIIVNGNVAPPATPVMGLTELNTGVGFGGGLITKEIVLESPLFPAPDAGLSVLMVAIPGVATKFAGITAVTRFPSMFPELSVGTTVLSVFPFH